jgi:hypothetical protein
MALKELSDGGPDGTRLGQSSTDLVAFYGGTPRARQAVPAAITDASGGTGAVTNGILTLTGTYNSTILANAIATLAASHNSLRAALVSIGIVA